MRLLLSVCILALFQIEPISAQCGSFRLASYYASNMVLQRPPVRPRIWGYAANVGDQVIVNSDTAGQTVTTTAFLGPAGNVIWEAVLQPIESEGPHQFFVQQGACLYSLSNVLIGDVWLCSGQSNMEFQMIEVDNPQPDLDDVVNYPNVRTFRTAHVTSATPLEDLNSIIRNWEMSTPENMRGFSSLCYFFGRNLFRRYGRPIGLIQSTWGGTRIEAWSSTEALARCPPTGTDGGANAATVLFNAMINPFTRFPIYGAIWYQGESNTGNFQNYPCYQKSMVQDWRDKWNAHSPEMDDTFPFGLTQLAPWRNQNIIGGFADIRWAQTDGFGYVPNANMEKFFMAVALDLPDYFSPSGDIHPRYKRPIGDRLELAGAVVAYGSTELGDFQGPLPTAFSVLGNTIRITYNMLTEKRAPSPYIEFCCGETPFQTCTSGGRWVSGSRSAEDVNPDSVVIFNNPCLTTESVTGYRYLWRESPCDLFNCPLYAVGSGLPAGPYIYHGPFTQE